MKQLLPIGTIVRLQEGEKYLMIIGVLQADADGREFDYISCPFPEGYIDQETFFLFNHDDIEEVEFVGCVNAQSQTFFEMLKREGYLDENEEKTDEK